MKKNLKIIIITTLSILIISILFICSYFNNKKINQVKQEEIKKEENNLKKQESKNTREKTEKIKFFYVDIKGAVNNPGVYKLQKDSRIIDVINLASGLKENADTSIINLSKKIEDEMVIIIYTFDELYTYKKELKQMEEINKLKQEELVCPDLGNKACINNSTKSSDKQTNKTENEEEKVVSINTATKEDLMTIKGIGEGKAESIIEYREKNGEFKSIEEIKNVSGIGDSLYEKIKDYITV